MKLSSILDKNLIFLNVSGNDRRDIYLTLLKTAENRVSLPLKAEELAESMIAREDSIMIPYEKGIALPHFRNQGLEDLYIIIGILENPVRLKEPDKEPAQIIIMSLISEKTSDVYLKLLSAFSKFFLKPGTVSELAGCGSANAFLEILDRENVTLKEEVCAEDIMAREFAYVDENAQISQALDIFCRESKVQLPVLDGSNRLAGILDAAEIIRRSIPKAMLMMDNVKFLRSIEPFERILNEEDKLIVKDFMREPRSVISPETPIIQCTVPLAKEEVKNMFVVDSSGRLLGIVTLYELIQNVLRV